MPLTGCSCPFSPFKSLFPILLFPFLEPSQFLLDFWRLRVNSLLTAKAETCSKPLWQAADVAPGSTNDQSPRDPQRLYRHTGKVLPALVLCLILFYLSSSINWLDAFLLLACFLARLISLSYSLLRVRRDKKALSKFTVLDTKQGSANISFPSVLARSQKMDPEDRWAPVFWGADFSKNNRKETGRRKIRPWMALLSRCGRFQACGERSGKASLGQRRALYLQCLRPPRLAPLVKVYPIV